VGIKEVDDGIWLVDEKYRYVATLVEWHSRFLMLVKVPGKETDGVVAALSEHIRKLPATLHRSLTWDRWRWPSTRSSRWRRMYRFTSTIRKVPGSVETNENTNLLLRQYFPRGTDLAPITQA